jgi:hypothetical protein
MRKALARTLIVASALSGFAFSSPAFGHGEHHGPPDFGGILPGRQHCLWNTHEHDQAFFQELRASLRAEGILRRGIRRQVSMHVHHAHECHGGPEYPIE